jgi:hypothetical protein
MFVGYLRADFKHQCEMLLQSNELLDVKLLENTHAQFPQYCFAAYEDEQIVGVLSAYAFDAFAYINVFEVHCDYQEATQRLLKLFLKNCTLNSYLLYEKSKAKELQTLGFKVYGEFIRFMHFGDAVAFNFSNTHAKQVSSEDYNAVCSSFDEAIFHQKRKTYVTKDTIFESSLKLATSNGSLHSYVVNKKYIRISPWLMKSESFLDAQKLLRAVLYYRGLKKIFAYAANVKEIVELYESYKFKKNSTFVLLYLHEKPNIALDNLYAI